MRELQAEVQRLRDENNHLKGEQGQPDIKPNRRGKQPGPGIDHSSEAERRKPQTWQKATSWPRLRLTAKKYCTLTPCGCRPMPSSKAMSTRSCEDVVIQTANVLYHKEKYYRRACARRIWRQCRRAILGIRPGIKVLALVQYFAVHGRAEILEFFANVGIQLSAGELSNWLIKDWPELHAEKAAIYTAGLRSSPWQHLKRTRNVGQWPERALSCGVQSAVYSLLHDGPQRPADDCGRAA